MKFKDRTEAGKLLGRQLARHRDRDPIVYGLPRGGVIVAYEVAKTLKAPLDVVISRKVGHPANPEYAVGAISESGKWVGNELEISALDPAWLRRTLDEELREARKRRDLYHKGLAPSPEGREAILVDDGLATGFTMLAAIREIRERGPERIVVAVPVAPKGITCRIGAEVDEIVLLKDPDCFLGAVAAHYGAFPQVSDREVVRTLRRSKKEEISGAGGAPGARKIPEKEFFPEG